MRKITIDYIKEKLKHINENIEVISDEINDAKDTIEFKCLTHGVIFKKTWENIKRSPKCPSCESELKQKYSLDDYKKMLLEITDTIIITNENNNNIRAVDKIKFKCKNCSHEWSTIWRVIRNGSGCPKCAKESTKRLLSYTLDKIKDIITTNISIINETYINSKQPLKCKCNICGYEFTECWTSLNTRELCPNCIKEKTKKDRHLKILKYIEGLNKPFSIINIFSTGKVNKLELKCTICGHIWTSKVSHIKDGHGCPKCVNNAKLTNEEFIKKCNILHNYKYDYSLVNYNGNENKVKIICPIHGEFQQMSASHLAGKGCRECANVGWYNSTLTERNKDKWIKEFTNIYVIGFKNEVESFIKIGIAKNIKNRIKDFKLYECSLIYKFKVDRYNASYLEKYLHNEYIDYKYVPVEKFKGYTECFNLDIPIEDVISTINEYEMITNE